MYEGVDTVVLQNELAYQDVLPVGWRPLAKAPGPADGDQHGRPQCAHPAGLRGHRGAGRRSRRRTRNRRTPPTCMRLEVKMNLLLDLMGQLLAAQQPRPPATVIRFNALGARVEAALSSHGWASRGCWTSTCATACRSR